MPATPSNLTDASCSRSFERAGFRRECHSNPGDALARRLTLNRSPNPVARTCMPFLVLLAFSSVLFGFAAPTEAKETCPWLNEATAAGFLDGNVVSTVTFSIKDKTDANYSNTEKNDATCEFVRHQGSLLLTLRVEVQTITRPPDWFASYVARCGPHSAPLKAIGNEAVACSVDSRKNQFSEQVVGRVRGRAFVVRITSNSDSLDRDALQNKVRNVAEQVAGFLF